MFRPEIIRFLWRTAWRDLRASGHSLWIFGACLALGVCLITAAGGLYRQVTGALLADTRALLGGDLLVDTRSELPVGVLEWMRERGSVSLMMELRTMLGAADGEFQLVELLTVDSEYPLYGELTLEPAQDAAAATGFRDGRWGVALDPVMAERMQLRVGDAVEIGTLTAEVRAVVLRQPDRSLTATWSGPPVLIAEDAVAASGLVQPGSNVDFEYRVRTPLATNRWRAEFFDAFGDGEWRVRSFEARGERLRETLDQLGSGLLLIGFSTLFVGGLGVFNSTLAYLRGKFRTIATLRAVGLRDGPLAGLYLLQIGLLGLIASVIGAAAGAVLSLLGASLAAAEVPLHVSSADLIPAVAVAVLFGVLTALVAALPAIGRALAVPPAVLFRTIGDVAGRTPPAWRRASIGGAAAIVGLTLLTLPDALFGIGFLVVTGLLLLVLDLLVRGLRRAALRLNEHPAVGGRFAWRLALSNLHRPGSPLRVALLSLGTSLTLLVACTLVVAALLRAILTTVPSEAPGLVFYDVLAGQPDTVRAAVIRTDPAADVQLAPLVQSRLHAINAESLSESSDPRRRRAARDEYKLSYLAGNIDGVTLESGAWWEEQPGAPVRVAIEDREAEDAGIRVGDRVAFAISGGGLLEAEVAAIYSQKGIQTRYWFEGIVSDGALEPYITRHVGAAWLDEALSAAAQNSVASDAPNVVTVRTATLLATARDLLGKAGTGLLVVAGMSLLASLLVLISVVAAQRTRLVYDATILHTLGTRLAVIRRAVQLEYLLLGALTVGFAVLVGSAIALPLIELRLRLSAQGLLWTGALVAIGVTALSLGFGVRYLMARLRVRPGTLLRGA
jgi:putative ABC transport system permease protein